MRETGRGLHQNLRARALTDRNGRGSFFFPFGHPGGGKHVRPPTSVCDAVGRGDCLRLQQERFAGRGVRAHVVATGYARGP